jgi:hypothetical protein
MSAIASQLVSINTPVRFKVVDTGTALDPQRHLRQAK